MGSIHVIGGAAAELIESAWLRTLSRVIDHGEGLFADFEVAGCVAEGWVWSGGYIGVGVLVGEVGEGVRWKICEVMGQNMCWSPTRLGHKCMRREVVYY